ncbi:conserved hypothetical protein [Brucella melitensis M5-90]|uniref:Uncharacterized protein n=1 Tax=Brucella canis (strain ATCC 23365 / NCTC 10854 / RM-666) TaxID=483179 RepID=A9M8T8_BRUC2|nr:Hypothetical protein BCAN_A1997 [Brucella canis ATCC 23365]ADZ87881.1 conserved hypothetical protein [Brucella melitensis M5-90]EFG36778.1 hypothetical protein BAZG_00089 [Brucella sp. NVSL 07-0026]
MKQHSFIAAIFLIRAPDWTAATGCEKLIMFAAAA